MRTFVQLIGFFSHFLNFVSLMGVVGIGFILLARFPEGWILGSVFFFAPIFFNFDNQLGKDALDTIDRLYAKKNAALALAEASSEKLPIIERHLVKPINKLISIKTALFLVRKEVFNLIFSGLLLVIFSSQRFSAEALLNELNSLASSFERSELLQEVRRLQDELKKYLPSKAVRDDTQKDSGEVNKPQNKEPQGKEFHERELEDKTAQSKEPEKAGSRGEASRDLAHSGESSNQGGNKNAKSSHEKAGDEVAQAQGTGSDQPQVREAGSDNQRDSSGEGNQNEARGKQKLDRGGKDQKGAGDKTGKKQGENQSLGGLSLEEIRKKLHQLASRSSGMENRKNLGKDVGKKDQKERAKDDTQNGIKEDTKNGMTEAAKKSQKNSEEDSPKEGDENKKGAKVSEAAQSIFQQLKEGGEGEFKNQQFQKEGRAEIEGEVSEYTEGDNITQTVKDATALENKKIDEFIPPKRYKSFFD